MPRRRLRREQVAGEAGGKANASTLAAIQRVLEAAGIEFIAENGVGPGVRLKDRQRLCARNGISREGRSGYRARRTRSAAQELAERQHGAKYGG
jgi:hypothetical protein